MLLQTNKVHRFGTKTIVSGIEVEWDKDGIANVKDDKKAELILLKHGETIFKKGEVPKEPEKEDITPKTDQELARKLKVAEDRIITLKENIQTLEAVKADLIQKLEDEGKLVPTQLSDEDIELIVGMLTANKIDLEDSAKEAGYKEEEWVELNKQQLAIYLIKKTFNANN